MTYNLPFQQLSLRENNSKKRNLRMAQACQKIQYIPKHSNGVIIYNNYNNCDMDLSVHRSSFHPLPLEQQPANTNLLHQECSRILNIRQPIDLPSNLEQFNHLPPLLRFVCTFYQTISRSKDQVKLQEGYQQQMQQPMDHRNCLFQPIKITLLKMVFSGIQKKLFASNTCQKYYEEMSHSLIFKPGLSPFFISILSEHTNFVTLDKFAAIHRSLTCEQYFLYLPIQLYYLYGGALFTIQAKVFNDKVMGLIEALGKTLSNNDNLMSRNIDFFKNNKERKHILDESLKVVMISKNKQTLNGVVNQLTNSIFQGREYLNKEEFLSKLQVHNLDFIMTIFLLLVRSQFILFQEKGFENSLTNRDPSSTTNFYSQEMTKLLNKCPFNGDERCNCKKCQCVRRNRQSAKLNQEKKRNALEQVETMKRRLDELEMREKEHTRKIAQLSQENMMLKTLLKEIKQNPALKSAMMQSIEPVSKILDNEL